MKRILVTILALAALAGTAVPAIAKEGDKPKELVGFVQELEDGTFFNLYVEGTSLTIKVWDKDKKEEQEIPWDRARIQYQPSGRQRESEFMTRSEDKKTLSSPRPAERPIAYQFWLFLFKPGESEATTINGRLVQPMEGDGASVSLYDLLEAGKDPNG